MALPVCIDYLNLSFPMGDVAAICREVGELVGASGETSEKGIHGYAFRVDFDGHAVVGHGGDSQRGTVFVSFSGSGCSRIARFSDVRAWGEPLGARITRCDVAADDFQSVVLGVDRARRAWRKGQFSTGGRPPNARLQSDLGSGAGSTLYVGSRDSGKLLRVYEKGKHLGDKVSEWVRAEVELLAKDRVIPWETILAPAKFLAGAYPYFARLSLIEERLITWQRGAETSLRAAVSWARLAVGKTINVMLREAGGDIGAVIVALRRDGIPRRLRGWFADPPGAFEVVRI